MNLALGLLMFFIAWLNYDAAINPTNPIAWASWIAFGFCIVVGMWCIARAGE